VVSAAVWVPGSSVQTLVYLALALMTFNRSLFTLIFLVIVMQMFTGFNSNKTVREVQF
jgi:hypothetical protein